MVVDSGMATGIEKSCQNLGLSCVGVFPEKQVTFPKIQQTEPLETDLALGHSHYFMVCNDEYDSYTNWGSESKIKYQIIDEISKGSVQNREAGYSECKKVVVCMGDHMSCLQDLKFAVQYDWPILVVKGSEVTDKIIGFLVDKTPLYNESLESLLARGHFYVIPNNKSEDIAAFLHFFLTVRPW